MAKLQSIWLFLRRHKYVVVTLIFFILIGFAGDSSLWQRVLNYRRMRVLENEIRHYSEEYEKDTEQLRSLQANPDNMERIARERYLMKKPNEDIFVFEEDLPRAPVVVAEHIPVRENAAAEEQSQEELSDRERNDSLKNRNTSAEENALPESR